MRFVLINQTSYGYVRANFRSYDSVLEAWTDAQSLCEILGMQIQNVKVIHESFLDCLDIL